MEMFQVKHDMVYGIAKVVHQANQAFRSVLGQDPGPDWTQCSDEQQHTTMLGVEAVLDDNRISAADLHENWAKDMTDKGWTHGPVKDATAKTHPCLVPYHELPPYERYKDKMFRAIVNALAYEGE